MKNFFTFSRVTLGALTVVAILAVTFAIAPQAEAAGNICCRDFGEGQLSELDNGRIYMRWNMAAEHKAVTLTVSGPCGTIQRRYDRGEDPVFQLEEVAPDDPNGIYSWELRIDPVVDPKVADALAEARGTGEEEEVFKSLRRKGLLPRGPFIQSGHFEVVEGEIVDLGEGGEKERLRAEMPDGGEAAAPGAELGVIGAASSAGGGISNVTGEQVISGDLVVYNSICVGFDCPTNPSFGADTIRLQENNLRIHVDDTSTAASFPNQDWRLEFNSNLNGGGEYFRVIDVTANRNIMTLEANAPSHSLYVDSGGRVGFGTQNPVLELHVSNGDTPALRLEQNTSSGFAAQTWDVAGNETSFFVRDATNGSTLPFRIFPGESSSALVIRNDNVGVGTTSPDTKLHVVRTASGNAELLKVTNNGPIDFVFDRSDISNSDWRFEAENVGFFISRIGSGTTEFELANNGDLEIAGDLTANGTLYPSSRLLKENFAAIDGRDVLERLAEVPVSLWNYKSDGDKQVHIGPVTEDFGRAFEFLQIDGKLNTIDLHGIAMAAIQGLNQVVRERDARIAELEQASEHVVELESRLAALEALLAREGLLANQ